MNCRPVLPLLKGAGGRLVKRVKVGDVIHGNPSGMVLVMDFDFADATGPGCAELVRRVPRP